MRKKNPALDFQPSPGTISVCHQPFDLEQELMDQYFKDVKLHLIMTAWLQK